MHGPLAHWAAVRAAGLIMLVLAQAFARFVSEGRGTPAPVAPTERLVIGGLSLSNTVAASVFERIRDFGIKRALGATDLHLLREVLGEALGVSLSGGAVGVGLALALGAVVDWRLVRDGQQIFLFSPRLLAFALAFSVILGTLAAAYATMRIAHLSPAEAIRRGT